MTLVGLAISELIFSVMEITEEEKCTDWTARIFSHLAGLVICFVVDRVVRLNDIISKLNSKVVIYSKKREYLSLGSSRRFSK